MRPLSFAVLLFALPACAARAQQKPDLPTPLATEGLAGQSVTVLPLTMAVTDPRLPGSGPATRAATIAWADSLIADMLCHRSSDDAGPAANIEYTLSGSWNGEAR